MPPLVEARRLGRRANGGWLFRDRSLTIGAGERISLSGPSGSGKTLLLRALALLDPLAEGSLRLEGRELAPGDSPAYRSRIAYLHQQPALLDGSVEDNLRLPFSLAVHRQRRFERRRAAELLEQLGRDASLLARDRSQLSGGEAQLVALARLLQLEPTVLLLDEPTAALDPASAELARRSIARWHAAAGRRAYLWVTHDAGLAGGVADRHLRLSGGRLEEEAA